MADLDHDKEGIGDLSGLSSIPYHKPGGTLLLRIKFLGNGV